MSAQQCLLETINPTQTPELNQVFPFTIDPVTYSLPGLTTIRGLAMQGTIFAMRDPSISGLALYSSHTRSPTIRVGFDTLGTNADMRESRKAMLLHECIHAMQDNRAARWMRVDTAEAAAYTAQCLFHRACGRTQGELHGLVKEAWDATDLILTRSGRSVTESDIHDLLSAIRAHPTYATVYSVTGRYDGIARPPPPPPPPSWGCSCRAVSASSFPSHSQVVPMARILGL